MFLEEAFHELSHSVTYLINFVAVIISTADPCQLQSISDLALKHVDMAEHYCLKEKEEMEQNIANTLLRRQRLEDDIKQKGIILSTHKESLQHKEKEVKSLEATVDKAKALFNSSVDYHTALEKNFKEGTLIFLAGNMMTAGLGVGISILTGGVGVPLLIGCQSSITFGTGYAIKKAKGNLDAARTEYRKYNNELEEHGKEKIKLQNECQNLQTDFETCKWEIIEIKRDYENLLNHLDETAKVLVCLLNCRHSISILLGRVEVLQKIRKNFQHHLRVPLEEIEKQLRSISGLNILKNFRILHLCDDLRGQLYLLPNVCNNELSEDYI